MDKKDILFSYISDEDRAYGLAGMAVSVAALDAFDRIALFSLDSEGPMVSFSHDYYFSGSPSISPKATWSNLINNFYITSTMVLSNIMARAMVREKGEYPEAQLSMIRDEMVKEGEDSCGLESEEVESIFSRALTRMRPIFSNRRLHPALDELALTFMRRRSLSGREIYDELRMLQLI
ncbi:MAG: hypothetical protein NC201_05365 [Prevotella sp.]|nr:hypothetical protein [Bacteroides sp.]MCM1366661.1 hypothetical protein [Prevotella sp.]MCM1437328.1 hypothetical protein [Prevotella sp.]